MLSLSWLVCRERRAVSPVGRRRQQGGRTELAHWRKLSPAGAAAGDQLVSCLLAAPGRAAGARRSKQTRRTTMRRAARESSILRAYCTERPPDRGHRLSVKWGVKSGPASSSHLSSAACGCRCCCCRYGGGGPNWPKAGPPDSRACARRAGWPGRAEPSRAKPRKAGPDSANYHVR